MKDIDFNACLVEQPEHPRLGEAIHLNELRVSILGYPGRLAARAYAYAMIACGGAEAELGQVILDYVGLEG